MHCPDCGEKMVVTKDNEESTCYTCFKCPGHYYVDTLPYDLARAIYIPTAGWPCSSCGIEVPFDAEGFEQAFTTIQETGGS